MGKINSKQKGKVYEQAIRKELSEKFYPDCKRSSYVSKYEDDILKKDITETGFLNIQLKATEKFPNFFDVLESMPDDGNYNIIMNKRNRKGEIVVMSKGDFYELLTILRASGVKI